MLLNGSNIAQRSANESQATLTISQLVVFNSKKKSSSTSSNRQSLEREPPLPLFVGLSIYAYTSSKKIINQLYQLGISVSYDRVDDLMNGLGAAVCNRFQQDGVVCPLNLNLSPAVKEDVQKYRVVAKTKKPFSMMPIDQAHEQNNTIVKGSVVRWA